jgi:deazaflavin-dependent oxidoreductase (nitroreductase family)
MGNERVCWPALLLSVFWGPKPMHDFALASLATLRVLYLTTIGRLSKQPRTIEIWFVYYQGKLYLNAEQQYEAHWVRNILHEPHVRIRLGEREFDGLARVLERQQDANLWQTVCEVSRQKYGWGEGLPVEIEPIATGEG